MQDQQARCVEPGMHVGEHVGHALVLDDRLVELDPLAGVAQCRFEGCPGDTQCLGGDTNAPAFQVRQGDGQALASGAEQVGFGNTAVA